MNTNLARSDVVAAEEVDQEVLALAEVWGMDAGTGVNHEGKLYRLLLTSWNQTPLSNFIHSAPAQRIYGHGFWDDKQFDKVYSDFSDRDRTEKNNWQFGRLLTEIKWFTVLRSSLTFEIVSHVLNRQIAFPCNASQTSVVAWKLHKTWIPHSTTD